ncbi:TPA: AraC family transcriptional regulator [Escherichia coli]|nr:AraC family transcriptional regulator [Escherichia coli]HCJ8171825.1 AraC family transcriptional regulator [Escherichia coli]
MFPYCFAITLRSFCILFNNEYIDFNKNEILLIKRNDIQYFIGGDEQCVIFIDIPCHIISDYLYLRLRDTDFLYTHNKKNSFFRKETYGTFLNSLIPLVEQQKNFNLYESALFVLLDYLNEQKQLLPVLSYGLNNYSLRVEAIVASDPAKKWYLSDVASVLCVSASQLKKKLHSEGAGFSQIITEVRMKKAINLMKSGNYNTFVIAKDCGYNSLSYFIHSFRKYYSVTPLQWLKQYSIKDGTGNR